MTKLIGFFIFSISYSEIQPTETYPLQAAKNTHLYSPFRVVIADHPLKQISVAVSTQHFDCWGKGSNPLSVV